MFLACFHLHLVCYNSVFELNPVDTLNSNDSSKKLSQAPSFPSADTSQGKSHLSSVFSFLLALHSTRPLPILASHHISSRAGGKLLRAFPIGLFRFSHASSPQVRATAVCLLHVGTNFRLSQQTHSSKVLSCLRAIHTVPFHSAASWPSGLGGTGTNGQC